MKRFDIEYVKDFCNNLGLECISDKYIDIKSDLEFICPDCGEVYTRNFNNIKYRKNILCYNCSRKQSGEKIAFEYSEVKHFIESESGCKLLSKIYKNIDSKLVLKCSCGKEFYASFYKFKDKNKRQCNDCGKLILKEKNLTPIKEIINIVECAGYRYIKNEANGGDQKILVQCQDKHTPYWVTLSKFKYGRRCPHCSRSLGEESICQELNNLKVNYKQEYTFDDLIGLGGGLLRYDFAIFKNDNISYLIEYDGRQHFERAFGDDDLLIRTRKHDLMKTKYAKSKNIPLLRIPYTEYNEIPQIINKNINQQV